MHPQRLQAKGLPGPALPAADRLRARTGQSEAPPGELRGAAPGGHRSAGQLPEREPAAHGTSEASSLRPAMQAPGTPPLRLVKCPSNVCMAAMHRWARLVLQHREHLYGDQLSIWGCVPGFLGTVNAGQGMRPSKRCPLRERRQASAVQVRQVARQRRAQLLPSTAGSEFPHS